MRVFAKLPVDREISMMALLLAGVPLFYAVVIGLWISSPALGLVIAPLVAVSIVGIPLLLAHLDNRYVHRRWLNYSLAAFYVVYCLLWSGWIRWQWTKEQLPESAELRAMEPMESEQFVVFIECDAGSSPERIATRCGKS